MNRKQASEKYLVVEQRGWRWVLLGLGIAALFSLTFKAIFSPRRIQYEIERALSQADPRIKTSIEGAYLSLSDGVWPRLAIVIDKFQVHTTDPCLFETKASIEQLVLPVAFSTLLDRTLVFKKIEVGMLKLEMRARREGCGDVAALESIPPLPQRLDTAPEEVAVEPTPTVTPLAPKESLERPPLVQTMSVESSLLRHVIFHQVQLHLVEWPMFRWHLREVDVQLPEKGSSKTHIVGNISLTSEQTRFPFQGINARLELNSDIDKASAKISGAWREGRVDVEGQWAPHRKDFHWKGSFKQIPWSQLIVLAQALGRTQPMPASSQAWVSADVEWNHDSETNEAIELLNGHIEGEFGDFMLGKVIAAKKQDADRWAVEPYKVLVKEVDIDILTRMLGWSEPPSTFERLGLFDGEGYFTDNQLVSMAGQWREMKIIFSNRGLRELQTIKSIDVEMSGGSNKWAGHLSKVQLVDGQWDGNVAISLDQNEKRVTVDTEFKDLKLNPDVEELMTVKGSLSSIEGKLSLKLIDGNTEQINGFLKLDRGVISDVQVDKLRLDFDGSQGEVAGKVQVQAVDWPTSQMVNWPEIASAESEKLQLKSISGQFRRAKGTLQINSLQGLLVDLKSRFQLDAGWRDDSTLFGHLSVKGERKNQQFVLTGTRQVPRWESRSK